MMRLLELLRAFVHERPPDLSPLITEARKQRARAVKIVEGMDQEHDDHVAEQRRLNPAEAIRLAQERRVGS